LAVHPDRLEAGPTGGTGFQPVAIRASIASSTNRMSSGRSARRIANACGPPPNGIPLTGVITEGVRVGCRPELCPGSGRLDLPRVRDPRLARPSPEGPDPDLVGAPETPRPYLYSRRWRSRCAARSPCWACSWRWSACRLPRRRSRVRCPRSRSGGPSMSGCTSRFMSTARPTGTAAGRLGTTPAPLWGARIAISGLRHRSGHRARTYEPAPRVRVSRRLAASIRGWHRRRAAARPDCVLGGLRGRLTLPTAPAPMRDTPGDQPS